MYSTLKTSEDHKRVRRTVYLLEVQATNSVIARPLHGPLATGTSNLVPLIEVDSYQNTATSNALRTNGGCHPFFHRARQLCAPN